MPQHVGMQRKRHKGNNVRIPHSGECGAGHIPAIGGRDNISAQVWCIKQDGSELVRDRNDPVRSFCFEIIYGILLIVQKGHSTPDGQRVALNVRPLQPKRFFLAKPAVQTEGAEYAGAWFYDYIHQNIDLIGKQSLFLFRFSVRGDLDPLSGIINNQVIQTCFLKKLPHSQKNLMAWGPFNAGGGGGSSGGTAADISYDNSKSGISAANVQEAIDALSVLTLTIQAVPAQSGSLTYTGSTQSPTWKGYDSSMMTIGGVTSGINAGTYTATFTPIGKYVWTDGTQEAKSVSWTIGRAAVKNVPAQTGSATYNGSAQSPAWSNYNSSQLTIGGTSSATNAGSYSATFTPTANYKWSDGTTTAKSASWAIGKAAGSITLSASSLSLTYPKTSGTITVTRPGSGTVTASSGNTNIATVSVSGTTITVTAKATGSATITVSVGADTNYTAPSSKTFTVAVTLVSKTLSSNSWAVIKAVSDAGQGANYWSIGATKSVTINGKVGATTISSLKVDAFIIGFNHNSSKEGSNRIHFQIGKVSGKAVALCDSQYNGSGSSAMFHMNSSDSNSGGWNGSYMRKTLLGNSNTPDSTLENSLMAALPSDLLAVMKTVTKYTDNTGGGSNSSGNVTATADYLFLLAEFEVFGTRYLANQYEQNSQKQYDYYKAGNSRVAYNHSAVSTAVWWWLRSAYYYNSYYFCGVGTGGGYGSGNAYYSAGLRPGFAV